MFEINFIVDNLCGLLLLSIINVIWLIDKKLINFPKVYTIAMYVCECTVYMQEIMLAVNLLMPKFWLKYNRAPESFYHQINYRYRNNIFFKYTISIK